MAKSKLFTTDFNELKAKKENYDYSIGNGLTLRVSKTGYRVFQFKYQRNKVRKTMTIGSFDAISLEEVQKIHQDARKLLLLGLCPFTEQNKTRQKRESERLSINDIADVYIENHIITLQRPENPTYIINQHIKKKLGNIKAFSLLIEDIQTVTEKLAPTVARKVAVVLHAIYAFCIKEKILNIANPLTGKVNVFGARREKKERTLSFEEIEIFINNLDDSGLSVSSINACFLLLSTGQRKRDILNAKWSDINFNTKVLSFPRKKLKYISKDLSFNNSNHFVHLSEYSLSILRHQLNKAGKKSRVFADLSQSTYNNSLTQAIQKIGINHFTPHNLQQTFVARNLDMGVDDFVLQKILNLKVKGVLSYYDVLVHQGEREKILEDWGTFLKNAHNHNCVTKLIDELAE